MEQINVQHTQSQINNDPVNNPSHYAPKGGIECIDVMVQQFGRKEVEDFCKLNAFKYVFRMEHKGNPRQDAAKARWYLGKYLEMSEGDRMPDVMCKSCEAALERTPETLRKEC